MATSADQMRAYRGPAIFERAFRPFFLGGAVFAGLALPLWLMQYGYGLEIPSHLGPRDYHIHEMTFGYLGAVITGFLLTAIPNWTGRLPVAGAKLMALSGLWLVGRLAMFFGALAPLGAAIIDSLFLIALAGIVWREIIAGGNIRNIPICIIVSLLAISNIAYHALGLTGDETGIAVRAALGLVALLISVIGGRVIPSFTRNWMAQNKLSPLPIPFSTYDMIVLALTALGVALWITFPEAAMTGWLFALLALIQFFRLSRWRGWKTFNSSMVLVLHVGYFWIPVWFLLMALAILAPDLISMADAMHALTAGAIGTMTLAIMTRAILGHSGRVITASPGITAIYIFVSLGAVLRTAAPFLPLDQIAAVSISGVLWSLAFWLFVVIFGPLCLRRREA